jgi:hypothetical protein
MPLYHRNSFRTRYVFRQQAAREPNSGGHWLLEYIKKNPIQSGLSIATLYGVLAIFAYHFHIDYFPSFDKYRIGRGLYHVVDPDGVQFLSHHPLLLHRGVRYR